MDDLSRFCCLNSDCPDHGKRGAGNLTVTSRYGPEKARRMLRCRTCKARFSERKGTPLFDARLPPEKVESVLEHVAEGCGVRQTGRLCRVAPNTVARYSRLAGEHARDAHDELVALSPLTTEVQFDEKWAFVAKKEAALRPRRPGRRPQGGLLGPCRLRPRAPPGRRRRAGGPDDREHRGAGRGVPPPDGRAADEPDDQRRLPGLRDGDPARLRRDGHARPAPASRAGPGPRTRPPRRA